MDPHESTAIDCARRLGRAITRRAAAESHRGALARTARRLAHLPGGVARRIARLAREHGDVAVFDVAFGSLKAFGVYPALCLAGLAWTLPLMEYAPLNTQLWTAGYLLVRRRLRSLWGRWRYGVPLARMDALRALHLGCGPDDTVGVHEIPTGPGVPLRVRVERGRWRDRWRRWRGRPPRPDALALRELEALVGDPAWCALARRLADDPWLHERALLERIVADPEGRAALRRRLPPGPAPDTETRRWRAVLRPSDAPLRTVLREEARALREALARALGPGPSAARLCLRALHRVAQRNVHAAQAAIRDGEYRWIAARLAGDAPGAARAAEACAAGREALRGALARSRALASRAAAVRSGEAGARLVEAELREARARGARCTRARLAAALVRAEAALPAWGPGAVRGTPA